MASPAMVIGHKLPKVLVVEDEFLLASALQLLLETEGAQVVGPVGHVAGALALITATPDLDCALLDVRLGAEPAFAVADALVARGIRFAFMSGYDRSALPTTYREATYFRKLEDPKVLLQWVQGRDSDG